MSLGFTSEHSNNHGWKISWLNPQIRNPRTWRVCSGLEYPQIWDPQRVLESIPSGYQGRTVLTTDREGLGLSEHALPLLRDGKLPDGKSVFNLKMYLMTSTALGAVVVLQSINEQSRLRHKPEEGNERKHSVPVITARRVKERFQRRLLIHPSTLAHPFKCLFSTYCIPSSVLGSGNVLVNKINWSLISWGL